MNKKVESWEKSLIHIKMSHLIQQEEENSGELS